MRIITVAKQKNDCTYFNKSSVIFHKLHLKQKLVMQKRRLQKTSECFMRRKPNKRRTKFTCNKSKYKACMLGKILNLPRSPGRLTNSLARRPHEGGRFVRAGIHERLLSNQICQLVPTRRVSSRPRSTTDAWTNNLSKFPPCRPGPRAPGTPVLPQPPQATQLRQIAPPFLQFSCRILPRKFLVIYRFGSLAMRPGAYSKYDKSYLLLFLLVF